MVGEWEYGLSVFRVSPRTSSSGNSLFISIVYFHNLLLLDDIDLRVNG